MGAPCPGNVTNFTDDPLQTGNKIKAIHINELREAINREHQRRNQSPTNWSREIESGLIVRLNDIKELYNSTKTIKNFTWNINYDNLQIGDLIQAPHIQEIRNHVKDAEDDCLCDCNYCTCNCNYCTCNCNYCTCNCDYACTCQCDYACTCDCNVCSCDCDVCSCDCNVCSCDCDVCSCDCNVCTCQCDYACTCVCDYCSCDCNQCSCDCNHTCTCHGTYY